MQPETTPTAEPIPSLPPRLAWFAVWRWKRRWRVGLILVLLVGYPLSLGPLAWLDARKQLPPEALPIVQVVYSPLGIACQLSDWCTILMGGYINWWRSDPFDRDA